MIALRPFLALVLSLMLVWASAGQARTHLGLADGLTVTLCDSSGEERTVTLGADGKPVTHHDCDTCLAAQPMALAAQPAAAPRPLALVARVQTLARPFAAFVPLAPHPAQPRAPPFPLV